MQVEILKFLLDAHTHLADTPAITESENLDDLQAVDRNLPDSDWFESGENREVFRNTADELWAARSVELEF